MKISENKISVFRNVKTREQSITTIGEYLNGIREGKWQDAVLKYRNNKTKENKEAMTAVMASGLFNQRSDSDPVMHSGLLAIDIDDKDQNEEMSQIWQDIISIPQVYAAHRSLGGIGIVAYFKIHKNKHLESFLAIEKMLANDYGIIIDRVCKNKNRLRFVSYDPGLYVNEQVIQWNEYLNKEVYKKEESINDIIFLDDDVDYVIKQIKERALNIAPDYLTWIRIAFAFASKYGESGRGYFKLISSFYSGKQNINPDNQYDKCIISDQCKSSGTSIKTFFYFAKSAGCNIVSESTKKIISVCMIRRKQSLTGRSGSPVNWKSDAKEYCITQLGETEKKTIQAIDQVEEFPEWKVKSWQGESPLDDVRTYLRIKYTIKYNEISRRIEIDGAPLDDRFFNSMYLDIQEVINEKMPKDKIWDLINSDNFTPGYNPVFDFIEKHKHLKPTGNIEKLAECIESPLHLTDPLFIRDYLKKWLLSLIGSCYGTYSIICLVLTGKKQGTRKTMFFRELLPEPLRYLFGQNKLDGKDGDIAQVMSTKLIVLDDEFGGKSKADEKKFKELISTDVFTCRLPYARAVVDMKRLAVLCGTTNEENIITDLTGNRRIIAINVDNIDEEKYNAIDKTDLFMEVYYEYRKDPKGFFLTTEDIEKLNLVTYDAEAISAEMELPLSYFDIVKSNDIGAKFMPTTLVRSYIEKHSNIRLSGPKLSIALKRLGFEYTIKHSRTDKIWSRGFWLRIKNEENYPIPDIDDMPF